MTHTGQAARIYCTQLEEFGDTEVTGSHRGHGGSPGGLGMESAVRMTFDAVLLLGSLCPQGHSKEAAHRTRQNRRLSGWCRERESVSGKVLEVVHSSAHAHRTQAHPAFRFSQAPRRRLGGGQHARGVGTGLALLRWWCFRDCRTRRRAAHSPFVLPSRGHGQPLRTVAIIS